MKGTITGLITILIFTWSMLGHAQTKSHKDLTQLIWQTYASFRTLPDVNPKLRSNFDTTIQREWRSTFEWVNALIWVHENGNLLEAGSSYPSYNIEQLALHLRSIYMMVHKQRDPIFRQAPKDPVAFAYFLNWADQLDSSLDGRFGFHDLEGLHRLLLVDATPQAAIGYGFRAKGQWQDRRQVLSTRDFDRLMPKYLSKLKGAEVDSSLKIERITRYVKGKIRPVPDSRRKDYWQTPQETLKRGAGDCEDIAVLFQSIANWMGIDMNVVVGQWIRETRAGVFEKEGHAWVEHDGHVIDPFGPELGGWYYEGQIQFNALEADFVSSPQHELFVSDGNGKDDGT